MTELFTREILQAINDWQAGYSEKNKAARAQQLRAAAGLLPDRFRAVGGPCYRSLTLQEQHLRQLGSTLDLDEAVSSWTLDLEVAKHVRGGVVPTGMASMTVIFRIEPLPEEVVLNLGAVYDDLGFQQSVARHRQDISRFGKGIGDYGPTQREVVIDRSRISFREIIAAGGESSPLDDLVADPEIKHLLATNEGVRRRFEAYQREARGGRVVRWREGPDKDRLLVFWRERALLLDARDAILGHMGPTGLI